MLANKYWKVNDNSVRQAHYQPQKKTFSYKNYKDLCSN